MTHSKLSIHAMPMHMRERDFNLARVVQPKVIKIVNPDANRISRFYSASPNSLFVLRDHPRSEQHDDVRRDPQEAGKRHAEEALRDYNQWRASGLSLPSLTQCVFTNVNEPKVWEYQERIVEYNVAYARRCDELGIRGGLLNLSVGWPANHGTGQPVDWSPYNPLKPYLDRHYLVLHEYWSRQGCGQNWGWWAGRYEQCPFDCKIIIGECGIDVFVEDPGLGQQRRGWKGWKSPDEYMRELAEYDNRLSADGRIIGATVFSTDFENNEWASFDTEPIHNLWIEHAIQFDPKKPPIVVPPVVAPPTGSRAISVPLDLVIQIEQKYRELGKLIEMMR